MKFIFMGTPDFSVGTLEALLEAGHEALLVVTQPDKPKGRGKAMQFSPVKEAALARQIPVFQPKRIREPECVEYLKQFPADVFVVVAFGQILTQEILDLPKYCCVNVHASLLPKYRGAAPIQWAVINGEAVSGVTTMRMDAGIDTGDMILKEEVPLEKTETGGSLFEKLSAVGASLCVKTLQQLEQGTAVFTPQDSEAATHTKMIKKELGRIDFSRPAAELERLIRGLSPWPSAYTKYGDKTLKIWKASVVEEESALRPGTVAEEKVALRPETVAEEESALRPGTVVRAKECLYVATGAGLLSLEEVQLEGKKRMEIGAFLRGATVEEGAVLGADA